MEILNAIAHKSELALSAQFGAVFFAMLFKGEIRLTIANGHHESRQMCRPYFGVVDDRVSGLQNCAEQKHGYQQQVPTELLKDALNHPRIIEVARFASSYRLVTREFGLSPEHILC